MRTQTTATRRITPPVSRPKAASLSTQSRLDGSKAEISKLCVQDYLLKMVHRGASASAPEWWTRSESARYSKRDRGGAVLADLRATSRARSRLHRRP